MMLVETMLEDAKRPEPHGARHRGLWLPLKGVAALAALPLVQAGRWDVEAHLATVRAFVPLAKRMAPEPSLSWLKALATATALGTVTASSSRLRVEVARSVPEQLSFQSRAMAGEALGDRSRS
jgi:hypothetical protein